MRPDRRRQPVPPRHVGDAHRPHPPAARRTRARRARRVRAPRAPDPRPRRRRQRDLAAADLPATVPPGARAGRRTARRPGARDALPPRPQRRHHQQRRGEGRHRLHHLDRCPDARHLAAGRGRLDHRRLLGLQDRDGVRARPARLDLPQGRELLAGRAQHVRDAVAHHPQHQRRPAGPDGRPDRPEHDDHRPDPGGRRHHPGPPPGRPAGRHPRRHPAADGAHRGRR